MSESFSTRSVPQDRTDLLIATRAKKSPSQGDTTEKQTRVPQTTTLSFTGQSNQLVDFRAMKELVGKLLPVSSFARMLVLSQPDFMSRTEFEIKNELLLQSIEHEVKKHA
jgi:hypothetical protein